MSVKVCLHLSCTSPCPSKFIIVSMETDRLTHFARQMLCPHSHNVNLTDTVMETYTVSVHRPLLTLTVAKPKSVLRSPLVLNILTEVQEILAAFKGPFAR